MDEQQKPRQLEVGAGQVESKLNEDFIEFLRKSSWPAVLLLLVVVGGYWGYQKWTAAKEAEVSRAFAEYQSVTTGGNPSPESLLAVADEFKGKRGVEFLAKLDAADAYMRAISRRAILGAAIGQDGTVKPEESLTGEQRTQYLNTARSIYEDVYNKTVKEPDRRLFAISAAFGLAAVEECTGNFGDAGLHYDQVVSLAEAGHFEAHARIAKSRKASLDPLKEQPKLYAKSELWTPPPPPAPTPVPLPTEVQGPPAGATPPAANTPAEAKPTDPAAPKPEETKPAEPKPGENKPADPASPK